MKTYYQSRGKRIFTYFYNRKFLRWILLTAILFVAANPLHAQTPVQAVSTCSVSAEPIGAYTITVCIDSPSNQSIVAGLVTVNASATLNPPPIPGAANPIQKMVFLLDGSYLLTDYQTPYTFSLPTNYWIDGNHNLSVQAYMRDGFISYHTIIFLSFANGITTPPINNRQFTPSTGSSPPSGSPLVVAAVGDSASGEANVTNVVNLIASWNPNMLIYLGDVYDDGTATEFYNWFGNNGSYFDRFRSITNPTVGNHEYNNGLAAGYMYYWNNPPHYYSINAGGWHIISLDSNLAGGETRAGSPVYQWLVSDLTANKAGCTLVYWHHPLYNIGKESPAVHMQDIWALLVQNKVDLVLTGHDHDYQRWVPLDAGGLPSSAGVTQFVVGTGGHGIQTFVTSDTRVAAAFDSNTKPLPFGALRLKLYGNQAVYDYITAAGTVLDTGSIACKKASSGPIPTPTRTRTPTRTATPRVIGNGAHDLYLPSVRR